LASLHHGADDRASLLDSLGKLYTLGAPVDWQRLNPGPGREALPLAWAALADAMPPGNSQDRSELLVLSARTPEALRSLASAMVEQLSTTPALAVEDLAYSASRRRSHLEHRLAVLARGTEQMRARLKSALAGTREREVSEGRKVIGPRPRVAFV